MDFSLIDYLDEDACYTKLVELLHPDGLACPRCTERQRLGIHRCHRAPVVDFQCGTCGRVFNAFTGTSLQGTHRRPSQLLMILHGIAKGPLRAQLGAREPLELRPQGTFEPEAPTAGTRPKRPGPQPTGRRGGPGRRDGPERGGKKAFRISTTPTIRRGGAPTVGGAMAPSRRTDRRSPAWSVASRGRSGWTWSRRRAWSSGMMSSTPRAWGRRR